MITENPDSSSAPMAWETGVAVIGAGPHGVAVGVALARALGPGAVLLIDPDEAPLAAWSARARAIGMRAMRSPWVHHCDLDPMALYAHVGGRALKAGTTPPVEVFESHAHELLTRSALVHRRGWVSRLRPVGGRWHVHLASGERLLADRVVLTGGLDRHRRRQLGGLPLPDGPAAVRKGRVAVVGAGHTGASAALHMLDSGGRVDLLCGRGMRVRRTDVEPGWFGPKHLRAFCAAGAPQRRQQVSAARRGSTTPEVAGRLRALRPCGRLRLVHGRAAALDGPAGARMVALADGTRHGPYEVVYEATGYQVDAANEPLLAGLDVVLVGGLPVLDAHLQTLPGLHISGALAELALGPAGRNLWGAQRAAERITAAALGEPAPSLVGARDRHSR